MAKNSQHDISAFSFWTIMAEMVIFYLLLLAVLWKYLR